jgi:hypothetical protein
MWRIGPHREVDGVLIAEDAQLRRSLALEADCYGHGEKGVHLWGNPFYWSLADGECFRWELTLEASAVALAIYALLEGTRSIGELIQLCDLLALEAERQRTVIPQC